jgi:hypothetical protein
MSKYDQENSWQEGRTRGRLWLLGCLSMLLYGGVSVLSFHFRYGEGHLDRPILAVLALLAAATLGYLVALATVLRRRRSITHEEGRAGKRSTRLLRVIILFSVAYRLVLLPSAPIQEIDYYRYLWDGRVCLGGVNPYRFSPQEVDQWGPTAEPYSELSALWQLTQESDVIQTVFQRVHHREVPTVYPPAAQAVFASAALVTPAAAPLWLHVLVLKALLAGFDLATLGVLVALLRRLRLPDTWCLAYGWCPLALKEFANSGHLDSIAVFFTTLAMFWLVVSFRRLEERQSRSSFGIAIAAMLALGVAILAKSYPVILLPVVTAFFAARLGYRSLVSLAALLIVVVAGYLPLCGTARSERGETGGITGQQVVGSALTRQDSVASPGSHHPWTGLGTFLMRWQMNDFLFMLAHENLRRPGPESDHWFVLVPGAWRELLHRTCLAPITDAALPASEADPAFLLTQLLMGTILLGLCLRWAWGIYKQPEPQALLRGVFLTLAWGWLLSSAQNPWYLLWCLPFMVFARHRSWFLLLGLAFLYYLRFWLEYQATGTDASSQAARAAFDFQVVWLEYLPFFLALLVETWWLRHREAQAETECPQFAGVGKDTDRTCLAG